MNLFDIFAPRPAIESNTRREHARSEFNEARNMVLDELETAVCDSNGKRFKEREVRAAMKTVSRL